MVRKMQLGIRLHDTKKLPIEERLADVKRMGFACGHMALAKVMPERNTSDEALTPGFAMYLKNLFQKNQLDCAVLGCYLNLANPDPVQLAQIAERYKAHIRFASLLGCGVVGTETGAPNTTYTFVPECHSEEALRIFILNLRPVVDYAEKMGVIVAIEPVWCHIVNTPERARRVLDVIDSPNLQIILDPVNLLHDGNYKQDQEVIARAFELLGKDIAVMHIKDYDIRDGHLVSMGAGLGRMDYTSQVRFIKEHKPFMHVTLEDTVPENNESCRIFFQKLYDEQ